MKQLRTCLIAAFTLCVATPASATWQTYYFKAEGFAEGATFTGTFEGYDHFNYYDYYKDGWIYISEYTNLSGSFSGNSLVPAITFDQSHVVYLGYDLDGIIGDSPPADLPEWGLVDEAMVLEDFAMGDDYDHDHAFSASGSGVGIYRYDFATETSHSDFSSQLLRVSLTPFTDDPPAAIPEPESWAMMLLGFGAIGTLLRRRRAIPPTPAFGRSSSSSQGVRM